MLWYPGASRVGGRDGLILEVRPTDAEPWIGMFASGDLFPAGSASAVALPDRTSLAVTCNGAGYRVCARDPDDWGEISSTVVRNPLVVSSPELVLFVEFTVIVAWGPHGRAWEARPPIYDDLAVVGISGHLLTATGSSPPGTTREFAVDLRTGTTSELGPPLP